MTDHRERAAMIEPTESQLPIEAIDSADPMLATEPTEPMLPMDSTDPCEPMDSNEFSDQRDHRDEAGCFLRVMRASSARPYVVGRDCAPASRADFPAVPDDAAVPDLVAAVRAALRDPA